MSSIGTGKLPPPASVEEMNGGIAADAEERRVAQREQAGLPQQHVVGQRQDAHHAHLAQHRDDEAGVTAGV